MSCASCGRLGGRKRGRKRKYDDNSDGEEYRRRMHAEVEQKRKSGITEQLKRLAELLPDKCTCEAHGLSHLFVLEKSHNLLVRLTAENNDLELKCRNVSVEECEKQVNNLKAKLEHLETENKNVKQLIHEAEEKCWRIEKSIQCDGVDEEVKQGESVSDDSQVSDVDINCAVDAGSQTSHVTSQPSHVTPSRFVSVSTLLSQQRSEVATQHRHGHSGSVPHQCQHAPAMTPPHPSNRMVTSQSRMMTPQSRMMTPQSRMVTPQSRMVTQSEIMTSQSRMMMSPSRIMTSQSGLVTQSEIMTSHPRVIISDQGFNLSLSDGDGRHLGRQRMMSNCLEDSVSETAANQMIVVSSREAANTSISLSTCGVASCLRQSPTNGQFQSSSLRFHPSSRSFMSSPINASQSSASSDNNFTSPSGQFVNSLRERAVNYSASCLLMSQCDESGNRHVGCPDGSGQFPSCRESGRHDPSADMSLCLPSTACETQRVRGTQSRETSSFSVQSLTGQTHEQRSLSLPTQRMVETSRPLYRLSSMLQNTNVINPRVGQMCSHNQWQHTQSVGYSPSNYVTPHTQFEGSFSIDAIQRNQSMPPRPQHSSQTFSIERLTSGGFHDQRTPSQSRFDIQSMIMPREEHVTPRETPSQWEGRSNYAVTTRLLGNDSRCGTHAQENGLSNTGNFLTHFNASNADCNSAGLFGFQASEWNSPSPNCQWQHSGTQSVHCRAVNRPILSTSEVSSRTSNADSFNWQF